MNKETALAVFENYKIRRIYDEESETWFFSVVDIIAALTQQTNHQAARNYWKVLRNRLLKEGSQSVTKCNRLKLEAADGKLRLTDVASLDNSMLPRASCSQSWTTLELGLFWKMMKLMCQRWAN